MENVVVLGFLDPAEARQALRELRRAHAAGEVDLAAAAVIGRRDGGRPFALEQPADDRAGAAAPGAVGQLLTGPFGLVLDHAPDAFVGSLVDVADTTKSEQLFRCFGDALPPGSVVTVALVTETDPEPVDAMASDLGAALTRRPREDVERGLLAAGEPARRLPYRGRVRALIDAVWSPPPDAVKLGRGASRAGTVGRSRDT